MEVIIRRRPNRGGRPKAAEPGLRLSTWIRTTDYDRLVKLARLREQSLSALVRAKLEHR